MSIVTKVDGEVGIPVVSLLHFKGNHDKNMYELKTQK